MPRLMVSISGVRGVYGDGLDERIVERFAYSFATLYPGLIVVGRDSRTSGKAITESLVSGLRKGVLFYALIPLFLCIFVFYSFLWNWKDTFYHCLFGLAVSLLLMEILFIRFRKIPFTSSYLPGKEKLHIFWIVYLLGFLLYVGLMSSVEVSLFAEPSRFIIFFGVVLFFVIVIRTYQNHVFYRKTELVYEEKLEPVMLGLETDPD